MLYPQCRCRSPDTPTKVFDSRDSSDGAPHHVALTDFRMRIEEIIERVIVRAEYCAAACVIGKLEERRLRDRCSVVCTRATAKFIDYNERMRRRFTQNYVCLVELDEER